MKPSSSSRSDLTTSSSSRSGLKRRNSSRSPSQVSLANDQADYSQIVDEDPGVLASGSQSQSLTAYDPWTDKATFNGRALAKDFDPRRAVPIMLSETWNLDKMDPTGWWMSEKLDGCRAYWTGKRLISRTGKDWKAPPWFLNSEYGSNGRLTQQRPS